MGVILRWLLIVATALSLKKRRKEIISILICCLIIYLAGYFTEGLFKLNFFSKEQHFYIYIVKTIVQLILVLVVVYVLSQIFKKAQKDVNESTVNNKKDMTESLVGKKERLIKHYRETNTLKIDEVRQEANKAITNRDRSNSLTTKKERILNKYRHKN